MNSEIRVSSIQVELYWVNLFSLLPHLLQCIKKLGFSEKKKKMPIPYLTISISVGDGLAEACS